MEQPEYRNEETRMRGGRKEAGFAKQKQSSLSREERYGTGEAVAGSEDAMSRKNKGKNRGKYRREDKRRRGRRKYIVEDRFE